MVTMPARRAAMGLSTVPIDAAKFESFVRAHEALVTGRPGGARMIARFIAAHGIRCDKREVQDADFTGADLSGSTFIGSDLQRAALYCANLTKCDFRGARLDRADLRGAMLRGAKLGGSSLAEADLRAAVLCAADEINGLIWLAGSDRDGAASLERADLSNAQAYAVDFTNCSLKGARLRNANLKNANFSNANLADVDLTGARLAGATWRGAILTGVDIDALCLPPAVLAQCVVDPTPASVARRDDIAAELALGEAWVASGSRTGRPAALDGYDLRPAGDLLRKRQLVGLSAQNIVGVGVDFSETLLAGANFDGADLRGAIFRGADLRGASFKRANLAHAVFQDATSGALPLKDGRTRPMTFEDAILDGTGIRQRAA
jgi:uncharacterized protein YjbI with pentapeptide repeats